MVPGVVPDQPLCRKSVFQGVAVGSAPSTWLWLALPPSRRGTWTPQALSLEDLPRSCPSVLVASVLGRPPLPFPTGRGGMAVAFSLPAPALRAGALGPSASPLALTDSARVCTLINQCQARHQQQGPHSSAAPSASYIPLFRADSDGKKTAHAVHERDETKMKRIGNEKRGGIFPPKHSNKYSAMII